MSTQAARDEQKNSAATEADYMLLLRQLKARSGISYRELVKRWKQRHPQDARARSTVADLFNKDTLPRKPEQLRQLVTLLVEAHGGNPHDVQRYVELAEQLLQSRVTPQTDKPPPHQPREDASPAEGEPDVASVATEADYMLLLRQLKARAGISDEQLAQQWNRRFPQDAPDSFELRWWCTGVTVPTWNADWPTKLAQLVTLLVAANGGSDHDAHRYIRTGQRLLEPRVVPTVNTEADYMALLRQLQEQSGLTCRQLARRWQRRFPRDDPPGQGDLDEWLRSATLPACWGAQGFTQKRLVPLVTLLVEASGCGPSEIDQYVQFGRNLLERQKHDNAQHAALVPQLSLVRSIDDEITEPLHAIPDQDAQAERAKVDVTELDLPEHPSQPQPAKRKTLRVANVLSRLLGLG